MLVISVIVWRDGPRIVREYHIIKTALHWLLWAVVILPDRIDVKWSKQIGRENVDTPRDRGVRVVEAETGHLASGFFFSSRRRHTRFKCDWSSDVCSSD